MTRRRRADHRAAWWHLYNRGLAKRPVFETACDAERFLEFLGASCAAGELEVHAFSLLTTHYHLLARSPHGRVSDAMQRIAKYGARNVLSDRAACRNVVPREWSRGVLVL